MRQRLSLRFILGEQELFAVRTDPSFHLFARFHEERASTTRRLLSCDTKWRETCRSLARSVSAGSLEAKRPLFVGATATGTLVCTWSSEVRNFDAVRSASACAEYWGLTLDNEQR